MQQLILGIVLFFSIHSISIIALPLRNKLAAKSDIGWKLVYTAISLIGIILIARGYTELKQTPTMLYTLPVWFSYIATILLLPTFVLFLAPYFPGRINKIVKHPQLISVKIWAFAHLLVNGALADVLLFGSFLTWAIADLISVKKRPIRAIPSMRESRANDMIVIIAGLGLYVVVVVWLHQMLIGVGLFV